MHNSAVNIYGKISIATLSPLAGAIKVVIPYLIVRYTRMGETRESLEGANVFIQNCRLLECCLGRCSIPEVVGGKSHKTNSSGFWSVIVIARNVIAVTFFYEDQHSGAENKYRRATAQWFDGGQNLKNKISFLWALIFFSASSRPTQID